MLDTFKTFDVIKRSSKKLLKCQNFIIKALETAKIDLC